MTNLDMKLATLGNSDLVKLYNATSRSQINRFADRGTALKRTAAAIDRVGVGELPGLLRQLGIVPTTDPAKVQGAGSTVTYASAAIAAGLTPKQARKVAERVAGELLIENKITGETLRAAPVQLDATTARKSRKAAPAPVPAPAKAIVAELDALPITGTDKAPNRKQAAFLALLTRPQGANRKELLGAIGAKAGASPSACKKIGELFGYDFHYTARTDTTPVQYRLTRKVAK